MKKIVNLLIRFAIVLASIALVVALYGAFLTLHDRCTSHFAPYSDNYANPCSTLFWPSYFFLYAFIPFLALNAARLRWFYCTLAFIGLFVLGTQIFNGALNPIFGEPASLSLEGLNSSSCTHGTAGLTTPQLSMILVPFAFIAGVATGSLSGLYLWRKRQVHNNHKEGTSQ